MPTTLTAWITALRTRRRSSAAHRRLLAALSDIAARAVAIQAALAAATRTQSVAVALSYEEVRAATAVISVAIGQEVMPADLDPRWREERVALVRVLRQIQRALFQLRFVEGLFLTRKVLRPDAQHRAIAAVRTYTVCAGDTLGTIAAAHLFARERWPEIAALNRLTYPYIADPVDWPNGTVAAPGSSILLPMPHGAGSSVSVPAPSQADLFGIDLDLFRGSVRFEGGDLRLLTGVANVEQAVHLRTRAGHGELPLHPEYGSRLSAWIGHTGTPEVLQMALLDYMRAVGQDSRVARVIRTSGRIEGDQMRLSVDAMVVGSEKPQKLSLIVPALGGGS
jgi:hypothetical protein